MAAKDYWKIWRKNSKRSGNRRSSLCSAPLWELMLKHYGLFDAVHHM